MAETMDLTGRQLFTLFKEKFTNVGVSLSTIKCARLELGWVSKRVKYCQLIVVYKSMACLLAEFISPVKHFIHKTSTISTMTARQAILQSVGPSHYVVQFDCDECIATVNRKQLVRPPLPLLGEQCWINWNGEDYSAKVVAMGDLVVLWCKERVEQNDLELDDVIFSDEGSVQLESHRKTCYHKIGQPSRLCGRPKHPAKVHVWGGISARGAAQVVIFTGIMNATRYTDTVFSPV